MKSYWPQHLSDDELIEQTRRNLSRSQKLRWLYLVYALAFFSIGAWFAPTAYDWIEAVAKKSIATSQWIPFWAGMSFGTVLGMVYILLFIKAAVWFILFLNPLIWSRRDRLLVEYYDELHKSA